ncbi:hypothetical protein, partial [Pontibacter sp. BAB1700]|uniref:hypothetical protein n=1 Tax=Pontibacter sp. BAB1700 TaxID=1144253 RepID=UPI00026BD1E7
IFLSFFFFKENGILIGFSLHMLLCSLFNQWLLSEIFKGRVFSGQMPESRVDVFKSLLGKAVPFLLSSIFVYPITWFTNRILVEQPDGLYELGLFNTTFQWRSIIIFFPMTIGQVLIPIFTSSIVNGDIAKIKRVLKLSIVASAVVSVGFTVIILLLYPFLLDFYGDDFNISIQLVIVTGLYTTISAVLLPMGNLINAAGKFWTGFYVNLGWAVVLVIAAWFLLINNYGAEGLAISYLIAYAFHMVWVVIFVFNYLKKASLHSERI